MGVFTGRDPFEGMRGEPMSLNGYSYVHGSPIMLTDPSGETPLAFTAALCGPPCWAAVAVTAIVVFGVFAYDQVRNDGQGRKQLAESLAGTCQSIGEGLGEAANALAQAGATAANAIGQSICVSRSLGKGITETCCAGFGQYGAPSCRITNTVAHPILSEEGLANPTSTISQSSEIPAQIERRANSLARQCQAGGGAYNDACRKLLEMCENNQGKPWKNELCRMRSTCTDERLDELGRIKDSACRGKQRCRSTDSCATFERKLRNIGNCFESRVNVVDECFQGVADENHLTQFRQIKIALEGNADNNNNTGGCLNRYQSNCPVNHRIFAEINVILRDLSEGRFS